MTTELVVSAETVHIGLLFLERICRIADRGLQVEIWDWSNYLDDPDELAAMDAEVVSITGYLQGNLTDDDAISGLLATMGGPLRVAEKLRCPRLNLHGTELDGRGLPVRPAETVTGVMQARATAILWRVAALGEHEGQIFTLENLNLAMNHPGTPFARVEDTLAPVSAVDFPGPRMNLDLYHAQIGEGNLIELCRRALPWTGEIQIADVPGRCEPGIGEINYPAVAAVLREMGYNGTVTLEAFARNDPDSAIDTFIRALTSEAE